MLTDLAWKDAHCIPLFRHGSRLWVFCKGTGALRPSDVESDVGTIKLDGVFALPGCPTLFRLGRTGREICVSHSEPAGDFGGTVSWRLPFDTPAVIRRVVGGEGTWAIVQESSGVYCGVEVHTGHTTDPFRLTEGEAVKGIAPNRQPLISSMEAWRVGGGFPQEGEIVSCGPESFITRHDPRDSRQFVFRSFSGRATLISPPQDWHVEQAVVAPGGFLAACVHPTFGFATWNGNSLHRQAGTLTLWDQNGNPPIEMTQGACLGTVFHVEGETFRGLCPPDEAVQVQCLTAGSSPCVLVTGAEIRSVVVSIHGGPDSFEWDDLRYSGLYRALAHVGLATLIVNAPGSRGLGSDLQTSAWADWNISVEEISRGATAVSTRLDVPISSVFGVSFGGWLALQVAEHLAAQVVAVAPILDLTRHVSQHSDQESYAAWAKSRFGNDFQHARAGDRRVESFTGSARIFLPEHDRVIDHSRSREVSRHKGWQVFEVSEGHVPSTPRGAQARWASVYRALIGDDVLGAST